MENTERDRFAYNINVYNECPKEPKLISNIIYSIFLFWRFGIHRIEFLCRSEKACLCVCSMLPFSFHFNIKKWWKRCRRSLAIWKAEHHYNYQKRIQQLREELHQAYNSTHLDHHRILTLKKKYAIWISWQNSRILWLKAGDHNTKYFQVKAKQQRSLNRITSFQDETWPIKTNEKEIHQIINRYFTELYTSHRSIQVETAPDKSMKNFWNQWMKRRSSQP